MKFNFNFFKKEKEESLDWIDETLKNGFFNNNNEEINPDDDDLGMPDYTLDDRKNITQDYILYWEAISAYSNLLIKSM